MACNSKPACDFIFEFLRCTVPEDMIDVELAVRTVKCIHTFRKDHTTESATCNPWSRQMKPFPLFRKKVEVFEEDRKDENSHFTLNPIKFTDAPTKRSRKRSHKSGKQRRLDMGCCTPSKAKRPAFSWAPLPATNTTSTTTMAINSQTATTSPPVTTSCNMCKKWGAPCPFHVQSAPPLHPRSPSGLTMTGMVIGKEQEKKKKEQQQKEEEKNKKEKVPNDF